MKRTKTALVTFLSWAVILVLSWAVILVLLLVALDAPKVTLRDGLIAGVILAFGYWFVVTGRLSRLFRKV